MLTSTPALYIATVLIWGSSWFVIHFQLGVVAPAVSIVYRFALAAIILLAYCGLSGKPMHFSLRDHCFIALQGLFLFSLNYLIFYWATPLVTTGLIAVIFSMIVFMNIVNSALFFRQRVQRKVVMGALLGLLGISFIFWPELAQLQESGSALLGLGLSLLGTFIASLGNMASVRNQANSVPVLQGNAFGMLYGSIFLTAFALVSGAEFNYDFRWTYSASLIYVSLFATILGFSAYLTLLGRIGADRAAYTTVLFPIVALSISTVFEGYQWSLPALFGIVLVVAGNVLIVKK